jgi:tetratricopeptide (TPR) repeat protein
MGICLSCLGFLPSGNTNQNNRSHSQDDSAINTSMEMDHLLTTFMQNTELLEFTLSRLPESEKWTFLDAVGRLLLRRYERTCSIDDINGAITMEEKTIELIPVDHPNRATYLNNFGIALRSRFERTGSIDNLDRAIMTNEQAIESTPVDHADRAAYLNNLEVALQMRFSRTGSMDDLDHAIVTIEQAIELTSVDNPDLVGRLNSLGNAL